eukprot:TRINITY_DN4417_c0_g1_i2.p2 TRINITY_DN4417_c0_g1~~TRINITY_DN4417_c0_g1_i2.p2  ORF type:complete len:135 (-),score=11.86 TRINITY_DN4417_c0_g1_i2:1095-1499(-)
MYKHWRSEWDEVHPNALGHQLIATLITRHLISIVMHVNENHIIEFLTKTKVLETTLGTSFAQPALCNATAFSFLSKSRSPQVPAYHSKGTEGCCYVRSSALPLLSPLPMKLVCPIAALWGRNARGMQALASVKK